jgi:SAM-dependent methyltransferase
MSVMQNLDTRAIQNYYEHNTRWFLRFAPSASLTIHRALWTEGVTTHARALNYSNELIRAEIESLEFARVRVLDLGCGVGASLFDLLAHLPIPAIGIGLTISHVQAQLAHRHARAQCHFAQADFHAIPLAGKFDVVYSIEAFCHTLDPARYFSECARVLARAGRLILVDDFLGERAAQTLSANERRWLDAYQNGWLVPNIRAVAVVETVARANGLHLVRQQHLTPFLKLRALPDFFARALRAVGELIPARHPIVPSMLGSLALQQCLAMSVVEYRMLVFEK